MPDRLRLNLFDDAVFDVRVLERSITNKGIEVWRGRTESTGVLLDNFSNVLILVNPASQCMAGTVSVFGRHFFFEPVKASPYYRLSEQKFILEEPRASLSTSAIPRQGTARTKRGAYQENGFYILDFFVGFSEYKAQQIPDLELVATEMIEHVNTALKNSRVDNVRLNLLEVGTAPFNPGVFSKVADVAQQWFSNEMDALGADFFTMVQALVGDENESLGAASIGDYVSTQGMYDNIAPVEAFRHELGHNVGGGHCPGDLYLWGFPYAHGFNNTHQGYGTIMCGNDVNMFSNPDILDEENRPLGDQLEANMAKAWRERAQEMSARRSRAVPATYARVTTTSDELADDGVCSFREVVANNTASHQVWSDCESTDNSIISFSKDLDDKTLVFETPVEITGAVEVHCNSGAVKIQGPEHEAVFIVHKNGSLRLHGCTVYGNQDADSGPRLACNQRTDGDYAGFDNYGFVGLTHSVVRGFETGIINRAYTTVDHSLIELNDIGIKSFAGGTTIKDSEISDNRRMALLTEADDISRIVVHGSTVSNNGCGIMLTGDYGSRFPDVYMVMSKSSLINNGRPWSDGGGIYLGNSVFGYFQETTISGNTGRNGGGIYLDRDANGLLMDFVTITNNRANVGGGLYVAGPDVYIHISRTIIADQLSGQNCWLDKGAAVRDSNYNLLSDDSCNISGPTILIDDSAHLGPLADNGGPTLTHALKNNSLAIKGSPKCCCTVSDQRGVVRPSDICDIGAFQTQYPRPAESSGYGNINLFNWMIVLGMMAGTQVSQ